MTLRSTNEHTAKSREMYSKHVAITSHACIQSVVPIPHPLSLCFGHQPMTFLQISCLSMDAGELPQKNNITLSSSHAGCSESVAAAEPALPPLLAGCR
ncbi:hypothetical protein L208DRAFT_1401839 [Tricholoma matsutake]|nr:hypothetical protein L208DRAFT_1401839 [Tricholoma matsutake 945]